MDRSLGTSPTGTAGHALQLALTNSTGGTLNNLSLGFDTTMLSPPAAADELQGYRFFYSLTGETGTWIAAPSFDPVTLNTDARFRRYDMAGTLGLAGGWAAGSTLLLRWVDDNGQLSPDQMLAVDNVTVGRADAAVPEPATWAMVIAGFGLVGGAMRRRSRTAVAV